MCKSKDLISKVIFNYCPLLNLMSDSKKVKLHTKTKCLEVSMSGVQYFVLHFSFIHVYMYSCLYVGNLCMCVSGHRSEMNPIFRAGMGTVEGHVRI